jgi:ribonuclease III
MPIGILKLYTSNHRKELKALKNILGFVPGNYALYRLALRHKSVASDISNKGIKNSNERLEFLGDAILGSVVAEVLFKKFPFKDEGFLTEMRSKIVNRAHLNQLSKKIGIAEMIDYDAKINNMGNKNSSLFGDAFEAMIGAIYLDKGYEFTRRLIIHRIILPHVDIDHLEQTESNYKSRLLEWAQKEGKEINFELLDEKSSGQSRLFTVRVLINGEEKGKGQDFSKKNAEKNAAEKACAELNIIE